MGCRKSQASLPRLLLTPTSGSHNTEPPKVLTAMGKMVQQIATINNLLIFINIQISQLQKSNEGRASGEGPVMAGISSLPPKAEEARAPASYGGDRGAPVAAPGPLGPDLWGLRGWGWLERLHLLARLGPGPPLTCAAPVQGDEKLQCPAPTAWVSKLLVLPCGGGGSPWGLGRPGRPPPPTRE